MLAFTGYSPAVRALRPWRSAGEGHVEVLDVRHFTEKLFSFRTTRESGFRFDAGQFIMLGLEVNGRPLMRAYSIASAPYADHLEFYSIKVPGGPLTSHLQHIKAGDTILISGKPTGTLLTGSLLPGERLWLLGTGTGFAPFSSIIRDPDTYDRFDSIVVVEGCRMVAELSYSAQTVDALKANEYLGEIASNSLRYFPTVTREDFRNTGRITTLIQSGELARQLGYPQLDADVDRVMICGNTEMLRDLKAMLEERGFKEGTSGEPGQFVIERAFVEH
ncbi:MAG: ferredoxin--NADP reductase [Hyphomicrobiaceae bacterium]